MAARRLPSRSAASAFPARRSLSLWCSSDIFPLGEPDGLTDLRDALLALRLAGEMVTVPPEQQVFIDRHGDVAPLAGGLLAPDGVFDSGDALVIVRRVAELTDW